MQLKQEESPSPSTSLQASFFIVHSCLSVCLSIRPSVRPSVLPWLSVCLWCCGCRDGCTDACDSMLYLHQLQCRLEGLKDDRRRTFSSRVTIPSPQSHPSSLFSSPSLASPSPSHGEWVQQLPHSVSSSLPSSLVCLQLSRSLCASSKHVSICLVSFWFSPFLSQNSLFCLLKARHTNLIPTTRPKLTSCQLLPHYPKPR